MRLCEEYLLRNSLAPRCARHVTKGFLYFEGGARLLAIEWIQPSPRPGFYEVSECELGRTCRTLSSTRVEWDDYESHVAAWAAAASGAVFDKRKVFDLTWQYFLRRHERDLVGTVAVSDIYRTVDDSNDSRLVDCFDLLESLSARAPAVAEFWRSRAFQIVSLYCYWMEFV